jgi:hypothetical protein
MTQHDRDEGLAVLLADLYSTEERDLESLVRFARAPGSLSALQREEIEYRLAADPSWRDRLRVLQNFDPQAAVSAGVGENDFEGAGVSALRALPLAKIGALVATAAAAGLAIWLSASPGDPFAPLDRDPSLAEIPAPSPRELTPRAQTPSVVQLAQPAARFPSERQLRDATKREALERPSSPASASEIAVVVEPLESSDLGAIDPVEDRRDAEADEIREEFELAMLEPIQYRAPADRAVRGFPHESFRGEASSVSLAAWVPDHVARTATPQPMLFWQIDGRLSDADQLGFVITSETEPEPLYEAKFPDPVGTGRQAIDLGGLGVSLSEDTIYRWTVFVRKRSSDPSEDRIAQGWIQYRSAPASLTQQMGVRETAERAELYAESGYWYDALALLVALREQHPGNEKIRDVLDDFLAEAGVE